MLTWFLKLFRSDDESTEDLPEVSAPAAALPGVTGGVTSDSSLELVERRAVPSLPAERRTFGSLPTGTASVAPLLSGARGSDGPSYLDALRAEAVLPMPLTAEEEGQVSELVFKVVSYVSEHNIDPPTMPALAPRVLDALRDPKLDVLRLARVLEQDQAIAGKLLTVANSVLFSPKKSVTTLRDAITLLGIDQVAQISIALATRSLFDRSAKAEMSIDRARWSRLFAHGMVTGFAATHLYAQHRRHPSEETFLAGLFHDVGKAAALRAIAAMTVAGKFPAISPDMLDEVLHRVHSYPGGGFYERWSFPDSLMQICSMHHRIAECAETSEIIHWVSVASSLDALRSGRPAEQREALAELPLSVERLQLSDAQLRAAFTQTKEFAERVQALFAA